MKKALLTIRHQSNRFCGRAQLFGFMLLAMVLNTLASLEALAQDAGAGVGALNAADTEVRSFFVPVTNIMFAMAAVAGLIGAYKVYQKFQGGDQDSMKVAGNWGAACIFLVIAAVALKAFFGVA